MLFESQYLGSQIDPSDLSEGEEEPWMLIAIIIVVSGVIIILANIM